MITLVSAVYQNSGVAKASGNPFKMSRADILVPRQDRNSANYQSHGQGLSVVELSVGDAVFPELANQFNAKFKGLPVPIDLELSMDSNGRNMIVGVKNAAS